MILFPKNAKCVGVSKTRPETPLSSARSSSGARILPSSDRTQRLQPQVPSEPESAADRRRDTGTVGAPLPSMGASGGWGLP